MFRPSMARTLQFSFGDASVEGSLSKIDRDRLYGYSEYEALDERDRKCSLVTLAADGRTLIGPGGSSSYMVDADGEWVERKELVALDPSGARVPTVESSFGKTIAIERRVDLSEFLLYETRSVYELVLAGDGAKGLLEELGKGAIFAFPYSFRGGIDMIPDEAFLLLNADQVPFLLVGRRTTVSFVGLTQAAGLAEMDNEPIEASDEELDFGMM